MTKEEFYFESRDKMTKLHGIRWIPDGKIHAILQIAHGMVEYIDRYQEFAEFLTSRGYLVTGHDHLGHGLSVSQEMDYGYFCDQEESITVLVKDIHRLKKITQEMYPDVPYYLLGHSMGSFLSRKYVTMYGTGIDGVLLVGTGAQNNVRLAVGRIVSSCLGKLRGWHYRSDFINQLAFGKYNKRIDQPVSKNDWLSREESNVKAYNKDKQCSFIFTVNGFYTLFSLIAEVQKKGQLNQLPLRLPVYFLAGAEDPVGHYGKDVERIYNCYKELGMKDVTMKLYPGDRHELLNETDKADVYADIVTWLDGHARIL